MSPGGFLERHCSVYGGFDGPNPTGNQESGYLFAGWGGDREDEHDGGEPEDEGGSLREMYRQPRGGLPIQNEIAFEDPEPSLEQPLPNV